ncbi:methyltransferase domain-containing protein [Streptococcus mutans]|uniref:methyltransferase domain-containing protein n=1 Tax=Streptococcus mutans TaxID=1309 RepID=UPI0014559C2C|nr:methyltransferase domain-containing protein [Streptococcus mutans]MDB8636446.1 methyltransferase domain-containing protein [Streptococcus mutans]NLQ76589.1 methyltransferase domain-containing protein [Streptococcus mutans]
MDKSLIFSKLQKRAEELEIIENLYEDDIFANYYRSIVNQDELLEDDIDSYKLFFDKSMPILEIGSGTGRIFNPLFEDGYNIFGLEPAKEMAKYITNEGRDRIYSLTLQEIGNLPQKNIEVIIIPATSVSLFSHGDFYDFLKKIKETQPHIKRIVFDFLKESFFESTAGLIQSSQIDGEKFYNVNFFDQSEERIIYNLVSSQKIGFSVKYSYSYEILEKLFKESGLRLKIIKDLDNYAMVEGVFHGEE